MKKSERITIKQFEYILDEFEDKKDYRMCVLSHLLFRCVRIGDALNTIVKDDIYLKRGKLLDALTYIEEKTDKMRKIDIKGDRFIRALGKYYKEIPFIKGSENIFNNIRLRTKISQQGIRYIYTQFIGKRGISQLSPHSFRRGGARYMFDNGIRIEYISDVLNHHNTRITEIYIGITPEDIAQAMECLHI